MKYLKYFESINSDKYVVDWYKVEPEIEAKLPYKEGDFVEVHVGFYGGKPTGHFDDIHEIRQILFVRWTDRNEHTDISTIAYATKDIYNSENYHFEVGEDDIVRKVDDWEVDALKYNL
jgi:hypothetical protein